MGEEWENSACIFKLPPHNFVIQCVGLVCLLLTMVEPAIGNDPEPVPSISHPQSVITN